MATPRATSRKSPHPTRGRVFHDFLVLPENRSSVLGMHRLLKHLDGEQFGHRRFPLLYLHGNPGSGKSHLLLALLAKLSEGNTSRSIQIVPAAEMLTEFMKFPGEDDSIRQEWKLADLLVVEDVQFFGAVVSESLINLLDLRNNHRRCTVLSSVRGPAELNLPQRLTSRMANGVVIHLEAFSPGSRQRFVEHHLERKKIRVAPEVTNWLIERGSSARELLGELHRIEILSKRFPPPFKLENLQTEATPVPESESPADSIVRRIAEHYEIPVKQLTGKSRLRRLMWPRQVAIYLLRELLGLSLMRIGSHFGGRDHTTVMHAIEKVKTVLGQDAGSAQEIRKLRAVLR